jgi:hypothetical protein
MNKSLQRSPVSVQLLHSLVCAVPKNNCVCPIYNSMEAGASIRMFLEVEVMGRPNPVMILSESEKSDFAVDCTFAQHAALLGTACQDSLVLAHE